MTTHAQTVTSSDVREQLQKHLSSVRALVNASFERGKAVPDLVSDPAHYERVRRADEAARLAFEQEQQQLERLVLDLIHTRDRAAS